MNIMIMAGGCKAGGGIQVADSICQELRRFPEHMFTVVLSNKLDYLNNKIKGYQNVRIINYTTSNKLSTILTGRDRLLDRAVENYNIEIVFFIFGPSLWIPKVESVAGFAMAHLVLSDSPFWKILSKKDLFLIKFRNLLQKNNFKKLANCYYTENPYISEQLKKLYPHKKVVTISNCYHQIYDYSELWDKSICLDLFDGFTLLTISAPYPHKNLKSIPQVLDVFYAKFPNKNIRFVITCDYSDIPGIEERHKKNIVCIGRVNINQCPWLYQQVDAMYLPTMLECFSANYVEAMKMKKPIITSKLGFAISLCGEAASYFDPTNPSDIANCINNVYSDNDLRQRLIYNGFKQLVHFETAQSRADKMIKLIEDFSQCSLK